MKPDVRCCRIRSRIRTAVALVAAFAIVVSRAPAADAGVVDALLVQDAAAPGASTLDSVDPALQAGPASGEPVLPMNMRPFYHVYAAFGVAWALILGYAMSVGRRIRQLEREIGGGDG